jgi:hypothetical protein
MNNFSSIDTELENEINDIFNNILTETCYIYNDISISSYRLISLNNIILLTDFTCYVPNLFRSCYAKINTKIPYICPTLIKPNETVNYFPLLLDSNIIKSFLYFNFPGSIKYFNNNYDFIYSIFANENIKKRNTTYDSYTKPGDIILNKYSQNSLLLQLISFNSYITACYNTTLNNLVLENTTINWDFTQSCNTYNETDNYETDVYTTGNYTVNNNIINNSTAYIFYTIKNSLSFSSNTTNETINNNLVLQKYSIFTVINIALEVFQDISEQISYYFQNKEYCKKSYMYNYNIPLLKKIYQNYYNNQLYTISKNLTIINTYNITPTVISIETYVNKFISIYNTTYSNSRYYIKTIYLNTNIEAFVFYSNISNWNSAQNNESIIYYYYYINIYNPSAVQLYDTNTLYTGDKTNNLNDFTSSTTGYNYYYLLNNTSYSISNSYFYSDGGLYPNAGSSTDNDVGGAVYYFSDNNGVLQSKLYETLQSPLTVESGGTDYPNNVPGIVLLYYNNI